MSKLSADDTTMSSLQQQLDELKHNMDREVSRRVKNTLESNADLKLEVRNLRAELTDQRASNKAVTAERDKLHGELVDVRSALAAATAERDSLRITLDAWEQADTKPHRRVAVTDVADHVVLPVVPDGFMGSALATNVEHDTACSCSTHPHPPCSHCQPLNEGNPEPDPVNDPKDAALEFRNVVPTPEMLRHVGYWDLVSGAAAIAFKPGGLRLVFWRLSGSQEWRTDPCPQPLRPHGMTWQQLDNALANQQPVPMCTTCHGCGSVLYPSPAGDYFGCGDVRCTRSNTKHWHPGCTIGPYAGPCKSATPVRHE